MGRFRAAAFGVGVAVAVFTYLALPLLRELYGPVVNLPVYAVVALTAGVCTYAIVRTIQGFAAGETRERPTPEDALDQGEGSPEEDRPQPDVDRELEQIKEDSGEASE